MQPPMLRQLIAGPSVVVLLIFLLPQAVAQRRTFQQMQNSRVDDPVDGGSEGDDDTRPWWIFVMIPIVSGLVGYFTNVLALKMTFFPTEFLGWKVWQPEGQPMGLFGWQGIVPAKAPEMAAGLSDLFLKKLFNMKSIFARIEPEIVRDQCKSGSVAISRIAIDRVVMSFYPTVWSALPAYVKDEVVNMVYAESAEFLVILMEKMKDDVLEILDVTAMVKRLAAENKAHFVQMFMELGAQEYRFVEMSGLYFGFLFGLLQALVFYFFDNMWVLPVAGLLVGWFTNFVALKLVFEPAEPCKFLCLTIQGVFLKRQMEASVMIADVSEKVFLRPEHIMTEIVAGKHKDKFFTLLDSVTEQYLEETTRPMEKLAASIILGSDGVQKVKRIMADVIREEIHNVLPLSYQHIKEALDLKNTVTSKLQGLPPSEFIGTLRPVFQEDEIKLIIVGAVLGMIVGFVQQYGLFMHIS